MTRTIRAPRGTQLTCKNWLIEAPYRMIQHNLEPEVAGDPQNLIVYGGRGRAARNWDCFDAILEALRNLEPDEIAINAAIQAFMKKDPTNGALFFYNPKTATDNWIRQLPVIVRIGNHVFARKG